MPALGLEGFDIQVVAWDAEAALGFDTAMQLGETLAVALNCETGHFPWGRPEVIDDGAEIAEHGFRERFAPVHDTKAGLLQLLDGKGGIPQRVTWGRHVEQCH